MKEDFSGFRNLTHLLRAVPGIGTLPGFTEGVKGHLIALRASLPCRLQQAVEAAGRISSFRIYRETTPSDRERACSL